MTDEELKALYYGYEYARGLSGFKIPPWVHLDEIAQAGLMGYEGWKERAEIPAIGSRRED